MRKLIDVEDDLFDPAGITEDDILNTNSYNTPIAPVTSSATSVYGQSHTLFSSSITRENLTSDFLDVDVAPITGNTK